jgi:hypothetical protein
MHNVVLRIHEDKDTVSIQLFHAHTSEPYGELQIPKEHVGTLVGLLQPHVVRKDPLE